MMTSESKIFIGVDGTYWMVLNPICEALNIDIRRSRELAKKDPILAPEVSEQALQVTKNGNPRNRNSSTHLSGVPDKYLPPFPRLGEGVGYELKII